jgi:hypothetical protein
MAPILLAGLAKVGFQFPHSLPKISEPLKSLVLFLEPSRSSAKAIGQAYLAQTPEEKDLHILAERLLVETSISKLQMHQVDISRSDLVRLCSEDFANGRTIALDGWLISRTEARLCAMLEFIA